MTYIIAEIGLAHMGRVDYATRLIHHAVSAGCDAVKFQVYKTEELIDEQGDPERYERFKERELTYGTFYDLKKYCEDCGINFLATPHTVGAFRFLSNIGVDSYKIGSGDRGEILELALQTGNKTYVSTGMRDERQLGELLDRLDGENAVPLHCITQYPVTDETVNLGVLRRFKGEYGYSDHYPGTYACELAVAMGASVIEKHIRLPETIGQDNSCALGDVELKKLVNRIRRVELMTGSNTRQYSKQERENEKWALKGKNGKRPYLMNF